MIVGFGMGEFIVGRKSCCLEVGLPDASAVGAIPGIRVGKLVAAKIVG